MQKLFYSTMYNVYNICLRYYIINIVKLLITVESLICLCFAAERSSAVYSTDVLTYLLWSGWRRTVDLRSDLYCRRTLAERMRMNGQRRTSQSTGSTLESRDHQKWPARWRSPLSTLDLQSNRHKCHEPHTQPCIPNTWLWPNSAPSTSWYETRGFIY